MYKIYLDAPILGKLEKEYLCRAIDNGFVSTFGPFVQQLEEEFARYLNVKKAVATQSGTAALHIALHELGIGRGDEVIVPVLTFIATVNPVIYTGAKPRFVDIDLKTWNMSLPELEKNINKRTKAIIPVYLFGNPCRIDEILTIAGKHKIFVIEDATESLGASYKGINTGTFGDLGCFSFNGNKTMTTGGGGMVAGNNSQHLEHIKLLINQANDPQEQFYHKEVGFNYRMTNLEASLGLAQIKRLNELLKRKIKINGIYREELKGVAFIRFQEPEIGAKPCFWMSCVVIEKKGVNIRKLQSALIKKGIPTRRLFIPLAELPPFRRFSERVFPNARYIYERGLVLPSSTLNSDEAIRYVCRNLKGLIA